MGGWAGSVEQRIDAHTGTTLGPREGVVETVLFLVSGKAVWVCADASTPSQGASELPTMHRTQPSDPSAHNERETRGNSDEGKRQEDAGAETHELYSTNNQNRDTRERAVHHT